MDDPVLRNPFHDDLGWAVGQDDPNRSRLQRQRRLPSQNATNVGYAPIPLIGWSSGRGEQEMIPKKLLCGHTGQLARGRGRPKRRLVLQLSFLGAHQVIGSNRDTA